MTRRALVRGLLAGCALAAAACGGHDVSASSARSLSETTATATAATTAPSAQPSAAAADWLQFGDDAQSSGAGPADTGITAATAAGLRLREVRIDGVADSAAVQVSGVVVHRSRRDVIVVTTSYGRAIAIDAGTGRTLWEFHPAGVNSAPGNPQVTTASPAADPDRRFVYSASPNGVIHKLALATGHQVWSRRITFDPGHEKIASSLHISGRWVVAVTGGYIGDAPPYDGHVVTIDRVTGRVNHVWNSECSDRHRLIAASSCPVTNTRGDNAIWGRAGAIMEPGSGRILVTTGNGPFDGRTSWGDSVLELAPDASRLLHNWTPTNQVQLDRGDVDLGSTSPALLPLFHGRRLAVQGGKAGVLDVLDLDRLNGTRGGAGRRLGGQVSETSAPGGAQVFTQPAVWSSGGRTYVFVADGAGTAAYQLIDAAHPRLRRVWSDGAAGTSPVVAGGLLYVFDPGGTLNIRRPLTGGLVRALPAGSGHWNSPIAAGGRIVEPTGAYGSGASSSTIDIWHLPGR
ncbi:MAG TPA: PQQ-binding-like beta-propeller repeat protein [Solirubrobacteraceae bacterium]